MATCGQIAIQAQVIVSACTQQKHTASRNSSEISDHTPRRIMQYAARS